MSDDELEQFYANSESKHDDAPKAQKVTKSKKSKRKHNADGAGDEGSKEAKNDETKKRARYFCSSPEQWRCVSKYGEQKMQSWIEDQEFQQKKQWQNNVLSGAHRILATVVDAISKGEGHVKNQILCDESLKQAIHEEGSQWIDLLSNKIKGATLLAIDVANGKSEQYRAKPHREGAIDSAIRIEEEQAPSGDHAARRAQEEEAEEIEEGEIALSGIDL